MKDRLIRVSDGWLFRVDEWAHRRGLGMVNGHLRARWFWIATPFPYLCNWLDRQWCDGYR
jgi:hypothetical protein